MLDASCWTLDAGRWMLHVDQDLTDMYLCQRALRSRQQEQQEPRGQLQVPGPQAYPPAALEA